MSCGTTCIKYMLFIFNLFCALGGLVILALGAYSQWSLNYYGEFYTTDVSVPSVLLIVAGALIFIVAFFGCCGAIRESHCMIVTFAVLLLIIFVLQLIGGILAFVYRDEFDASMHQAMKNVQKDYARQDDEGRVAKSAWDSIQRELECCGVDRYTEWTEELQIAIPDSCRCEDNSSTCRDGFYTTGCYPKLKEVARLSKIFLGAISVVIAIVELAGVVFALVLANAIRNQRL